MNVAASSPADIPIIVDIRNGTAVEERIIVRPTNRSLRLDGQDYRIYRIVRPPGYEGEEIIHRPERGTTALLAVVFITLAEAQRRPSGENPPDDREGGP